MEEVERRRAEADAATSAAGTAGAAATASKLAVEGQQEEATQGCCERSSDKATKEGRRFTKASPYSDTYSGQANSHEKCQTQHSGYGQSFVVTMPNGYETTTATANSKSH